MGSTILIVAVCLAALVIAYTEAAGSCPLPSKIYSCSPKCNRDSDCKNAQLCCQNSCNAKSCSVAATNGVGTGGSNKYGGGGVGVYCDNVKCQPYEVCKMDSLTKRNKCSRA